MIYPRSYVAKELFNKNHYEADYKNHYEADYKNYYKLITKPLQADYKNYYKLITSRCKLITEALHNSKMWSMFRL